MRTVTNEEFIKRAKAIHGDNYDYSKSKYKTSMTSIIVICKKHGEFNIRPNNHISGKQGCGKCGHKMKIFTTDEFVDKAKEIHGTIYDYSKSVYTKMGNLLIITCPIDGHGDFNQTPSNHITHQQGCYKCTGNYKSNTIEFVEKARSVHGDDTYDYSMVNYENRYTHVDIICRLHGPFSQTPGNHLYGYGCQSCGDIKKADTQKKPVELFIEQANNIHDNKYDYSNVIYKNSRTCVTIVCPHHGSFLQTPDSHLRPTGCPKCITRHSKPQLEYLNFVAALKQINITHAENGGEYKIPNTKYSADGYDSKNNTIYEYHGDFWHGNPKIYNENNINPKTRTTFGQLYENTIKREEDIKSRGFKLTVIWDSEWKRCKKTIIKLQRLFRKNRHHSKMVT